MKHSGKLEIDELPSYESVLNEYWNSKTHQFESPLSSVEDPPVAASTKDTNFYLDNLEDGNQA
jgi:hypothetical protein